jgi:outer membrane protein assembly factor BamB
MKSATAFLAILFVSDVAFSDDWPTWRHDAQRSAATEEQLARELHLQWSRQQPQLQPAWPEDARLQFDSCYAPIVAEDMLFVVSSRDDSVAAIDTTTGEERWRFYADGPVRLAPVAWNGNVYFGADDGQFRCLDARTGAVRWTFNAAPAGRLAIGNERLISVWPIRTGPIVVDGKVYFTAGVWPFEGTLLYILDAATGQEVTVMDLRDQSPQGYLVESKGRLFIPCGRSKAYGVSLQTGDPLQLNYDARGMSDCHVTALGQFLFHGGAIFDADENREFATEVHRPISHAGEIYFTKEGAAQAADLDHPLTIQTKDRRGQDIEIKSPRPLWKLDNVPVTAIHLRAGSRVYAHREQRIMAIDLPQGADQQPVVSWKRDVGGAVDSMLAANQRLFVVTREGTIYCFGPQRVEPRFHAVPSVELPEVAQDVSNAADAIVRQTSMPRGYCLVLGIGDGQLIEALLQRTPFHLIAVDRDEGKVHWLRQSMDRSGRYGTRIVARTAAANELALPPYMASLITSADIASAGLADPQSFVHRVFETLRPYGGAACFALSDAEHQILEAATRATKLPNLQLSRMDGVTVIQRVGALPDSADWTHEFADPGNTLMSRDKLVRAPLGVLWFGGPSSDASLYHDRHDWAPSLEVIGGRMFIQGPHQLTAVDVYTGQILWQKSLPIGISPGRSSNWDPSGYHIAAASDGVYMALPKRCLRYDPVNGRLLGEFTLPEHEYDWGNVHIWNDRLIVPAFKLLEGADETRPLKLYSLDRNTGRVIWSMESQLGFPLLAIGDDRLFCYEGKLAGMYRGDTERRRGGVPAPITDELKLRSFDINSGEQLWTVDTHEPASWLSFSADYNVLLMSSRDGITAMQGRNGRTMWTKRSTGEGFRGHPENYWDKVIIWHDQILDQRGPGKAYHLLDGEPVTQTNPLTGASQEWTFTKVGHHCNYAIASEALMTFRADTAGFCDIQSGETARLNGFRPGCRNSLIPANGVLNAPNFGSGCVCSYSIFTSMALVHVPDADTWTYSAHDTGTGPIRQLGINLGAPGDRRAENGTLWLDYPNVGGPSPQVDVAVVGKELKYYRIHPLSVTGVGLNWVAASGVEGIESISVPVFTGATDEQVIPERRYTVRLHFCEPSEAGPGGRVFDVQIQGGLVAKDVDIVAQAGAVKRSLVKEFHGVVATKSIEITLPSSSGAAVVSGVEVVLED